MLFVIVSTLYKKKYIRNRKINPYQYTKYTCKIDQYCEKYELFSNLKILVCKMLLFYYFFNLYGQTARA